MLEWQAPELAERNWQKALPKQPTLTATGLLSALRDDILPAGLAVHHPRNLGHQVAMPLPLAALCDLVAALTNQAMAIYETGPAATLIERQVIDWLGNLVGWQETEGILTSGGAQANLTALLAARQVKARRNVWKHGVASGAPLKILASEYAHYSVSRAAGIMGLGTEAVIKVPADSEGRMDVAALIYHHKNAEKNGDNIIAVVANAGCTPTGSIDPLTEIGTYCNQHALWLHVDGAHGASALLSEKHRGKLAGIDLADSVVWDGHKLLYMPATVSAVLFKNPQHSFAAFSQDASYLFQGSSIQEETYNTSFRTLECTKRMMGLNLWAAFSLYGVSGLGHLVDNVFATARLLAEMLNATPGFDLRMLPETNIVCFRHHRGNSSRVRKQMVESGSFHLTQVNLHGEIWLRTTVMNPFTTNLHLETLLEKLIQYGNE